MRCSFTVNDINNLRDIRINTIPTIGVWSPPVECCWPVAAICLKQNFYLQNQTWSVVNHRHTKLQLSDAEWKKMMAWMLQQHIVDNNVFSSTSALRVEWTISLMEEVVSVSGFDIKVWIYFEGAMKPGDAWNCKNCWFAHTIDKLSRKGEFYICYWAFDFLLWKEIWTRSRREYADFMRPACQFSEISSPLRTPWKIITRPRKDPVEAPLYPSMEHFLHR